MMGRSSISLTPEQVAEVETLAAVQTSEQIADYLGIGRRTFYDLMARDETIAARYKRGRAKAIGAIAQSLITKARSGNIAAMIFFLKTQAGWRETAQVELTGNQGGPLQTLDVSGLSTTTLEALANARWLPNTDALNDAAQFMEKMAKLQILSDQREMGHAPAERD